MAQDLDEESIRRSGQQATEVPAWFLPGLRMLVLGIVAVLAGTALAVVATRYTGAAALGLFLLCTLVLLGGVLVLRGLTAVVPGQARVVQLFGGYRGTIREPGLR
ncbi:MAG TPA: hypothetical protein VGP91_05570, partial [Actinoplanes sp.]|nr:hypothetical protein [Actinoplanes sp.]